MSTTTTHAPWRTSAAVWTAAALAVVALAALVASPVRHQLALSLSRQDPSYTELYFASGAATSLACTPVRTGTPVRFDVAFHGDARVGYRVEVLRPGGTTALRSRSGSVTGKDGAVSTASVPLTLPRALARSAYDVRVLLPATGQVLLAHCPKPARAHR